MTEERRIPNWLVNEQQHMKVKHELALAKYQVATFTNELKRIRKKFDELVEGQPKRKKAYGLKYDSREAIDEAYMVGALDEKGYMRQRAALWQTYSDRGYLARIEWLESELEKYQRKLENIETWMGNTAERNKEQSRIRFNRKQHHRAWSRQYMRRKRSAKKRAYKEELRKRYMYYGNK